MPRGVSIPINAQCVKLHEQGWDSSDQTEEDKIFQSSVRYFNGSFRNSSHEHQFYCLHRDFFYNINDPRQKDKNRIAQLMLALQFEIIAGESQSMFPNVTIFGKEPADGEKDKPIKPGEMRYKFQCDMKKDVLSNFATIRLLLGSRKSIFCSIEDSADGFVYFNPYDLSQSINTRIAYDVVFMPNDLSLCLGYLALKSIQSMMLTEYFCDFDKAPLDYSADSSFSSASTSTNHEWDSWLFQFDWINKKIESNEEQKIAVQSIVNGKARPFPFIVFGPPGKRLCETESSD